MLSGAATALYTSLLWWKRRVIARAVKQGTRTNLYSEQSFYTNYIPNMYPSAFRTDSQPPTAPVNNDEAVNQLRSLMLRDARPSPDASSGTFRIDLPEDPEERDRLRSQELVGTPTQTYIRDRANSRPDSLSENWSQLQERGRTTQRPSNNDLRSNHSRGISRDERRREIELGATGR